MVNWKEIAKENRFVAAAGEIRDIAENKNPINNTGDWVDFGVALDMYVNAHKINLIECRDEYMEFKGIAKGLSYKIGVIADALK